MKALVIGCGRVGSNIALQLDREGWEVVAVRAESDMRYFLKARKVLMQVIRECAADLYCDSPEYNVAGKCRPRI